MKKNINLTFILIAIFILTPGCSKAKSKTSNEIKASGTISVETVQIASELGGKISEISVENGAVVTKGDLLFKTDSQLLQAQKDQSDEAVKVTQANLELAQEKVVSAQTQLELTQQAARQQDIKNHLQSWKVLQSSEIALPNWYFEKDEIISALKNQSTTANQNLSEAQDNLNTILKNTGTQDFLAVELRLAQAQSAFAIALQTLNEAKAARDTAHLQDEAQSMYDAAKSELDAAQKAYDNIVNTDTAKNILNARAKVTVANEIVLNTQDALDQQMTGSDSLQVALAVSTLEQAKTGVALAEASLAQAEAAQELIRVQLEKTSVVAPIDGIILSNPIHLGEIAAPGAMVMEIGSLHEVTLSVYIPENLYGKVNMGQQASISVDSFPGETFSGIVTYISDQAEFTPRNVQTVESRSTTVYKIEIILQNPDLKLKPGMPADAVLLVK